MPHDPEWVAEVSEWLTKSEDDLRAARILLNADPTLAAMTLFHCQQSAEKALKGFLVWHGRFVRKTHDIAAIGLEVTTIDPSLVPVVKAAIPLSTFAWLARYPGTGLIPDQRMVDGGLHAADEVLSAIRHRLFP